MKDEETHSDMEQGGCLMSEGTNVLQCFYHRYTLGLGPFIQTKVLKSGIVLPGCPDPHSRLGRPVNSILCRDQGPGFHWRD